MPKRKDDFDLDVKIALAKRAGYHCSFPGCNALTVGPSQESDIATTASGTACHISAASAGSAARRYDSTLTSAQRKSIANGIWLCYDHGKIIDTDEVRYTIPQLRKWRELAERRAHLFQTYGTKLPDRMESFRNLGLATHDLQLTTSEDENITIGRAIEDSCVGDIWGTDVARAIRDYAIEMARNAFQHGSSTYFKLTINPDLILMQDDGADFDPWTLVAAGDESGGRASMQQLVSHLSDKLVVSFDRDRNTNATTIGLISDTFDLFELTPCSIEVTLKQIKERSIPIQVHSSCRLIYVVLPEYLPISDAIRIPNHLEPLVRNETRPMVFVLQGPSPKVRQIVERHFPDAKFIVL